MEVPSTRSGSSCLNTVEIEFIDKDDLPLVNVMEHQESDNDLDSDFQEVEEEDDKNGTMCGRHAAETERSRNMNVRTDISFNEPTGPTVHL